MLFHELYGNYFNAVAEILNEAVGGTLTRQKMYEIIERKAFAESALSIPDALGTEWPLVTEDYETPLLYEPQMPLTTLQKRWMKALLEDPRIRLFDVPAEGLEDVKPLHSRGTVVYFDQYADGDPYEDEQYVEIFRTVLQAVREKRRLKIVFQSGQGKTYDWQCVPLRIEYSLKDDKFRLVASRDHKENMINIARIAECSLMEQYEPAEAEHDLPERKRITMELTDERNALERAMLHFSHLEKETTKLDEDRYRITLWYKPADETEILIRVLSFGPMLKVLEPESFIARIRQRLEKQFATFFS